MSIKEVENMLGITHQAADDLKQVQKGIMEGTCQWILGTPEFLTWLNHHLDLRTHGFLVSSVSRPQGKQRWLLPTLAAFFPLEVHVNTPSFHTSIKTGRPWNIAFDPLCIRSLAGMTHSDTNYFPYVSPLGLTSAV